uniref:Uncharacterized protein n=1 Tax=Heliothis virescens TaxID=7102 RepID=A0A2A4J7R5_HELVI
MSIYFDFDVGPKGRMFRRAVEADKDDIELIWNLDHTKKLFYDINIGSLIELSALSICMINEKKEVIGFMALSDHPDVSGLDPSDWEYWTRNLFQRYFLSRNTLFIHFMCCIDAVTDFFVEEAFISVFMNDCYLNYIVLVVPVYCPDESITRFSTFKKRNIMRYTSKPKDITGNYLYAALRADFCPRLRMRRAVEEDNDDIVEILDKKCPRLKQLYGEYYISEIIGRHPESKRKIIVADVQGRAVAVACINTDINYKKLQKVYELRPFHGLRSATPLEKEQKKRANTLLAEFGEPIMLGQWTPFDRPSDVKHNAKVGKNRDSSKNSKRVSKASLTGHGPNFDHMNKSHSEDFSERVLSPSASAYSVVNLLDEDPFDYDIVNIDATLLNHNDALNEAKSHKILSGPILSEKFSSPSLVHQHHKEYASTSSSTLIQRGRTPSSKKFRIDEEESTIYHGDGNAFMIELFAFREDIDERYAYDLLEAAFELTKDYDYCIIRVPSADKTFPLLQHFCFVPTKNRVCSKYSLYVAHRSSVLGKLRVRDAEMIDIPQITQLMVNLDAQQTITTIETTFNNKKDNQAYVFTSGMQIVGLGILEPPDQIDFLRGRYNLDSYQIHKYHIHGQGINAGFATIKFALVYPVFEPHFRFFLREMMRLSGNSTLLWLTAYRNKWTVQKANSMVASMIPLKPRTVEIDSAAVPELRKTCYFTEQIIPFSTWFISKKYTTMPKVDINTHIVVAGASRTCLGFLNGLLFGQTSTYLTFNNVTLISHHGLPYKRHSKPAAESMFLRYYATTDKYMKCVPYTYYVNVIQGTVMEMDFETSTPQYTRLDQPRYSDTEIQIANDDTPDNVFIINSIVEANRALTYVQHAIVDASKKVIVYGATIHAYLCINALLESRIPPENIIFIEPFPYENPNKTRVPVFDNVYVDKTVIKILDSLKVKVYRSFYFNSWSVTVDNVITHADFLSYADYLNLECSALFYFGKIGVNMRTFIAIHKSGLAYDAGIVIDHEFRTLDPYVYAAGPCTRYHKRYYADDKIHKHYESSEIGEKVQKEDYSFYSSFEYFSVDGKIQLIVDTVQVISHLEPVIVGQTDSEVLITGSSFPHGIPFSTWFISKKYTTMPKVDINTHIVVAGASRTCLGFLNGLLFGQTSTYLTFNNVTLISHHGLPYKRHSKPAAESMFLRYYATTDKYMKCVPYTYYVNVIQGTVMEMDLQNKFVTLTSGSKYYYDLLFLFFGKQYQHPDHMAQLIQREQNFNETSTPQYTRLDQPRYSDTEIQIANDDTPDNVFIINSIVEANRALTYVQHAIVDASKKVIVYGATIHAYLCINALLESRIPPENIIFIEPFPYENPNKTRVPVFDNVYVDKTVIKILDSLKVKVYRSFYFNSWSVTVDNVITHADFLSYADYLNLECSALFYFGKIGVNMRTFIAIHKSGLAYDAGIVIDHEFRTLDPYVYAAGPCTRYHKRYYADDKIHKHYESSEIGEKLGTRIKKRLDPLFVEANSPFTFRWSKEYLMKLEINSLKSATSINKAGVLHNSDYARPEMALMSLTKPKVMYCVLPGGLKYLEVRSPGKKNPHNYVQSLEYNGYVFETFKSGYFKIHLNKDLIVDGITCLCQGKFSLENFKHIYGRPASELNNLHVRYLTKQLDNFFEFFRASWAFFLYHDHADDLFAMIKQLFPKGHSKGLTVKEALCDVGMRLTDFSSPLKKMDQKMVIQANFSKSPHIEAVTDFVIDWLSQHDVLLPMYLQPGQTVLYEQALANIRPVKKQKRTLPEMLF